MTLPNLYYLKYFSDAVELGSISSAAERNFVTHPAVSKAIQVLESQMDMKLLVHKKKSFEVTPAGRLLAKKAKSLLLASHKFSSSTLESEDTITGTITLGISRTLAQVYLPAVLMKLAKNFPQLKVNIQFGTTLQIGESIAKGSVDVGLTIGPPLLNTVKQKLLRHGQFVLIRSKQKAVGKNFAAQNLILTEPRLETELFKRNFYRYFKTSPLVRCEVSSWDMICDLTANGFGIGLVPDISLNKDLKKKVSVIKTDWFNCPYEIYLSRIKTTQRNTFSAQVAGLFETAIK